MDVTFDPHLFTQIDLDSGALTMLGTVVHQFSEAGEYRCVVHEGTAVRATFTISSDKNSSNAQAVVDLEALVSEASHTGDCECGCGGSGSGGAKPSTFSVNPRGYAVFRVGKGKGQYYVHARRVDAAADDKGYETRMLVEGDSFSAIVLRPGTYDLANSVTRSQGRLVVTYPRPGERRYRPDAPVRVRCGRAFEPAEVTIGPGQGVIFEACTPSRITVTLSKPDDGPQGPERERQPRRFIHRAG
jgi:plastocyanin